jgi:hypothetical protein
MRWARIVWGGSSVSVQFPADTGATKDGDTRSYRSIPSELDDGLEPMIQPFPDWWRGPIRM